MAKDCWSSKKIQKVEEQPNSQASASSSSSTAPSATSTSSLTSASAYNTGKQVRLVKVVEGEDEDEDWHESNEVAVFDFTENDETCWHEFENVFVVKLVEDVEEHEEFHDCFEVEQHLSDSIPGHVDWVSMDIQDGFDNTGEDFRVNAVRREPVVMTLDSGADVSVMPEEYACLGVPGSSHLMKMVDAQGERISTSGNRKLTVVATTRKGERIEFVENFAVGAVSHPLMCFGKFLKQGWTVAREGDQVFFEPSSRNRSARQV